MGYVNSLEGNLLYNPYTYCVNMQFYIYIYMYLYLDIYIWIHLGCHPPFSQAKQAAETAWFTGLPLRRSCNLPTRLTHRTTNHPSKWKLAGEGTPPKFNMVNKDNPSAKSGLHACISSRITTVIHVVKSLHKESPFGNHDFQVNHVKFRRKVHSVYKISLQKWMIR